MAVRRRTAAGRMPRCVRVKASASALPRNSRRVRCSAASRPPASGLFSCGAYVAQGEIPIAIEEVQKWQDQRRRHQQHRGGKESPATPAACKELQTVQQPARQQAEISSDRTGSRDRRNRPAPADIPDHGACSGNSRAAPGVPPIRAVRLAADAPPGAQCSRDFGERAPGSGICSSVTMLKQAANEFDRNGSTVRSATASSRGIIPGDIAHRQIHAAIALRCRKNEHTGLRRRLHPAPTNRRAPRGQIAPRRSSITHSKCRTWRRRKRGKCSAMAL